MAVPYSGRGTAIGLGAESTWGTAVSRTNWLKAESVTLNEKVVTGDVPHLVHGDEGDIRDSYCERTEVTGRIVVELRYDGCGMLLAAALGGSSTAGTGSPYTHTYALSATLGSLTIEVKRGTSGNSQVFEGCKVTSFEIAVSTGQVAKLTVDFIGQTSAARSSTGTPSFGTGEFIEHKDAWSASWGGTVAGVRSLTIRGNNNLARVDELGSAATQEPEIGSFRRFTCDMERSYRDDTQYAAHKAETQQDLTITCTGDTSPNAGTFLFRNAKATDVNSDISDFGVLTESLTFTGYADASDPSFEIAIVNGTASAIAN